MHKLNKHGECAAAPLAGELFGPARRSYMIQLSTKEQRKRAIANQSRRIAKLLTALDECNAGIPIKTAARRNDVPEFAIRRELFRDSRPKALAFLTEDGRWQQINKSESLAGK